MCSCEFCEISKNTFLTKHLRWLHLKQSSCQTMYKHASENIIAWSNSLILFVLTLLGLFTCTKKVYKSHRILHLWAVACELSLLCYFDKIQFSAEILHVCGTGSSYIFIKNGNLPYHAHFQKRAVVEFIF